MTVRGKTGQYMSIAQNDTPEQATIKVQMMRTGRLALRELGIASVETVRSQYIMKNAEISTTKQILILALPGTVGELATKVTACIVTQASPIEMQAMARLIFTIARSRHQRTTFTVKTTVLCKKRCSNRQTISILLSRTRSADSKLRGALIIVTSRYYCRGSAPVQRDDLFRSSKARFPRGRSSC